MILPVHTLVRSRLREVLSQAFGLAESEQPPIVIETPPRRVLGDLAVPVAFELARRLRKAPRAIAQELQATLGPIAGVARVEAAPNGYLNLYLDRAAFVQARARWSGPARRSGRIGQGHRRAHGDQPEQGGAHRPSPQRRARRHAGPAPAVSGPPGRGPELHRRHRRAGGRRGRRLSRRSRERTWRPSARWLMTRQCASITTCWDLYARVTEWYEADKTRLAVRAQALHAIEEGGNDLAAMGAFIADRIVRCHLAHDGADERGLRPADLGGRHPAAPLLGDRLRAAQGAWRGVPANRGPAEGLLGDADRGRPARAG